jgi:hypothetical protein
VSPSSPWCGSLVWVGAPCALQGARRASFAGRASPSVATWTCLQPQTPPACAAAAQSSLAQNLPRLLDP